MEAQKVKSRRLSKNKYAVISADDSQDSLRVKSRRLGKSTKTNVSGLGYVGGKLGTGALGIVEGTADLLAGTAALLGGNKDLAEYLFMHDNWVSDLNAKLDEGYDPGKVMRFVGDTASGLGQSATFLIPGAGQVLFFTGVLGNGISSASQKTGKVGFREYGYGALSAALEFTLERFVSGTGQTLETLTRTGAKNIGSAVTKAVGKTAAKNTARKMVATQLISSAVGEGVEEFFGNVGDHFLQKITGVDRESEFDFGAALYDFVVGMASGGLMGGVSTTVQTAYEKKNGAQINADEGRRERMLRQARGLVESAKKQNLDKGSDAVATYLSMLEAGLNTYDGAKGKSGAMAEGAVNLALGKINSALMSTEFNIITDRHAEHIASLSEAERSELAAYANDYFKDAGANVTAEDLLDINNEYTRALASLDWAGNVVRTMVGVNGRVNTEIAEVMQREMLAEDEAVAAKEKAAQREGFQKLRSEAEKRAVAIGESEKWRGEEAVYSYSLDGVSGYLKLMKEADGYKAVTISEKRADEVKLTEEEVKKFLAALRESQTAQKSKTESKAAEGEETPSEEKKVAEGAKMTDEAAGGKAKGSIGDDSVPPRERSGGEKAAEAYEEKDFTATPQEVKAAMKAVKVYKLLPPDRRQAIIEMMRSAGGIDKVTVASIANIMSARDGLHVRFMKGHRAEGSHDVLKSGERLILLNPEKTEGKYWRRDILFHELWHDLSRDGGTKVLTEEIYRRSAPAFQHMVVDRYTKYYNGVSMSKFLDGKKWTEENVKAYFDTYTKISYDEVMEEVAAGTAGRVMGSKNFIKNFRDVSMLRRVFYGISDVCRAMVNKTYMTNGEETAGFMLSFKEALTFRRLYELAYTKERFHLDEGVLRAMEEIFMERDEGDRDDAVQGDKMTEAVDKKMVAESGNQDPTHFSLEFSERIAERQLAYAETNKVSVEKSTLTKAIGDIRTMVGLMTPYKSILPPDKVGKTVVSNGSYDRSIENTTVCVRTLAYNEFIDLVQEKVGRPLTAMESFLVSQKLYDIAKEPQCLYGYVSLDRKAYNEMMLRYLNDRDAVIEKWKASDKSQKARETLYQEYLRGRKDTKNMKENFELFLDVAESGDILTAEEVATEARRAEVAGFGSTAKKNQLQKLMQYAQSASWAKKQQNYVAYTDEIIKFKPGVIANLNKHYGLRWYSFSDYSGAFIVENMQQITDASLKGLKGLAYTKDTDFVEIFAPSGININISVFVTKGKDGYVIDEAQSADLKKAIALREQYPNVGIVAVATDNDGVRWALDQAWSDVVIPFHTVRTGADVANFYEWDVYNEQQSDKVENETLWDAYVASVGKKKVSKNIYPSEHHNDRDTYLALCRERGLKPRFSDFLDSEGYMKLVNETRQSADDTASLQPIFNLDAAKTSFQKFVDKGGYYDGWYFDDIDLGAESDEVASDIAAGKTAKDVDYGRQDVDYETMYARRKDSATRRHSGTKMSLEIDGNGTSYVRVEREAIDTIYAQDGNSLPAKVRSYLRRYRKTVLPLGSTDKAYMRREGENEYTNPAKYLDSKIFQAKMEAASEFKNILMASTFIKHEPDNGNHPDAVRGWNYYKTTFVIPDEYGEYKNGYVYTGEIVIKLIAKGDCFYDMTKIEDITNGTAGQAFLQAASSIGDVSHVSISQSGDNVNSKNSLSLDADIPPLSAAEVEGDANRVSWGFSWTDEKLLSNIRKVQKYFRERYPDHMVEFELDNKKKRIVIVAIRPMREARMSKAFTAPLAENDAYHEELAALFRSIGISDDRISEHISVFETEEEKTDTIERAKKQNEGKRLKVYHKQEVAKSIEGVLSNVLSPIVGPSKLMGKKKRALITRLWQELNRAKASEREKLAERFAEELIVSTVYDDYEVNAEYEQMLVDGTVESYETVEGYRGKLSAEDVSGDLVARYGEKRAKAIMRRWLSKEGGVAVGTALAEMQNEGILTEVTAKNDADLLIALNEEYERLKERTSMRRELLPLAAMSKERLSAIKSELKTSLLTFFNEGGKDTKYGKLARRYQELLAAKDQKMSEELQSIEKKLTDAFASRVEKLREETAKSREYWQKRASEARYGREYAREQNRVLADVRGLRDYLNRDYTAASEGEDRMTRNIAKAILKATGKIGVRADKAKIAAKIMLDWVNTVKQSNPDMVGNSYLSASLTQEEYDALVKVSSTSAQEGDSLTLEELQAFHRIVNAAKRLYHSYDKVWINGKWVNVEELAREAVSIIEGSYTEAKGIKGKLRDFIARATKTFLDPLAVAAHIDGYRTDGVITRLVTELALAEAGKNRMIIELRKPFEDFFKEHKRYAKTLAEKKIKLTDEFEITLGQAITLHEMFKRDQAKAGLMLSRIGFHMDDGTIKKLEGYGQAHFVTTPSGEKVSLERAREILRDRDTESVKAALKELGYDVEAYNGELAVKEFSDAFTVADSDAMKFMDQFGDQRKRLIEGLEKDFTAEDREFLKVVSHFFQETSKNAKKKADLQNIGYSNVIEGYYFPIKRMQGDMAKNIADGQFFAEFATTSNISFNQSTVEGAKASVEIFGIWDVVTDHINGLAMWEHLYLPVQNINKVWNKNVGKGTGNVVSVKNQLDGRGDGDFTKWMSDLLLDVQGARQKETKTWLDTALEKLRGGYAVFQLGANVQTIAKQTLSWVAATQYIDPLYMAQGVKNLRLNADKLNTYSAVAAERENDATVVRAFSNTEKVTKLAEKTMIGITAADRVVNMAIWSACQKQVAAENPSMPIGSEENLKQAGKLCDEVIMKVQDSSDMTTKSQAARSSSEFIKSLTMFQSAGLKMFSRLWEGMWRVTRYQKLAKSDAAYQKEFASAKKQLVRTVGAFAGVSVGTAVIVQLFKVLFNKEREDKEGNEITVLEDMALDTFGEAVGVIPVIGDLTDYFLNGYELSSYSYDMLNEMLTATKENMALLDKLVHGEVIEEWEIGRMIRKTTRSAGMMTGIPIRNVENFVTGLIRRFSKETGYAYDTLFYNANYTEDLNRAIAKGEDEFARVILELMMKRDKTGSRVYSDDVLNTITTLHGEDYSVLPRTIDTDEVRTRKRLKEFEAVYQKADSAVEKLVSREEFKALATYNTEEGSGQALAIKTLYTGYYQLAEHDVLGKELTRSAAYMTVTDPVNLMLVKAYDKAIKLEAVEMTGTRKAMLAAYMKTLGMDNTERAYAAYACGFRTDDVTSKILKDLKGRENEEELLIALGFKEKEEEKEDAA